jgi:polysaccharide biosynthesis transport protein
MTLQQLLLALRARWPLALLVFVLTVAASVAVSLLLPAQFTATSTVVVDPQSRDPLSAVLLPPGTMTTQEDIIKSERVAQKVVKALKLDDDEAVKRQWREDTGGKGRVEVWLAELLQKKLAVVPPRRDSNVLAIQYTAVDPAFAAAAANAFAQSYVETAVELKSLPARQYARWFDDQARSLRAELEKAQARLSQFQQAKGIVTKEENYDSETARLADLMGQLTAVQSQVADSGNKRRAGENLPEVAASSVVQFLRGDIARQEAKLKEASLNLGANHPQYQRMQAELAELHAKLKAETRYVSGGFSSANAVSAGNERELKAAVDAQKRKLLDLRRDRDELAVLQRDVETAQGAYAAVAARYTQTSLESQAKQTNVSVLSAATEPLKASSPNIARYSAIGALFGLLLAMAAVFGVELIDRRLRSPSDVTELLQAPVLAVMKPARARGWATIRRPRRPTLLLR